MAAANAWANASTENPAVGPFLGKKGPTAGNASAVFYGAYVFFEEVRVRDGKPKSKHRLEMEKAHGAKGMDRERRSGRVWRMAGEKPYLDKLGQIHIDGKF
ncbi:uncharacterized protein RSE6_14592 [Rhynchosporium secalis]|uniref:DUF7726 domain-containing protein n=1 Tax=Rhynchosporium secalis TaxID=38038 RepID=A0A1E1MVQ8_RHYSE|nr:uncharacterized protein RSE6_14592 [Rhynchosporium secalis]